MKFSMMTYTMDRQRFPVESMVKTAAELKMDGIDWVTTHGRDPRELKKMSTDAGLEVACHTFVANKLLAGDSQWLDEVKQSLDDAVTLGAPVVMIPTMINDQMPRDEFRNFWINALERVAPLTDEAEITLSIENFPGEHSAFVTAADYFEAKKRIPQLKLTYDNGNAAGGEDPLESLNICKDDIVHVHFKDWYIRDEPAEGYRRMLNGQHFKPALIGQGDIPTTACLKALKETGYDGYINIEYEGDDIPADEGTKMAIEFMRNAVKE